MFSVREERNDWKIATPPNHSRRCVIMKGKTPAAGRGNVVSQNSFVLHTSHVVWVWSHTQAKLLLSGVSEQKINRCICFGMVSLSELVLRARAWPHPRSLVFLGNEYVKTYLSKWKRIPRRVSCPQIFTALLGRTLLRRRRIQLARGSTDVMSAVKRGEATGRAFGSSWRPSVLLGSGPRKKYNGNQYQYGM